MSTYWEDHDGFQAKLDRVVDGDTIDMICDTGFRSRHEARVRLVGVDTAEIYGVEKGSDEYERGQEQSEWVFNWFEENRGHWKWPWIVDTGKDTGKYGRWPGFITSRETGNVLNADIVEAYPDAEYHL